MVEIRKQADEVKAARAAKKAEVASWVIAEPVDYVEKKPSVPKKRKKAKAGADVGGSEGEAHSSGQDEEEVRPKKKKSKPKKKYVDPDGEDGDTPMGSDGEEKPKPKPKKKVSLWQVFLDQVCGANVLYLPRRHPARKLSSTRTTTRSSSALPSGRARSCSSLPVLRPCHSVQRRLTLNALFLSAASRRIRSATRMRSRQGRLPSSPGRLLLLAAPLRSHAPICRLKAIASRP